MQLENNMFIVDYGCSSYWRRVSIGARIISPGDRIFVLDQYIWYRHCTEPVCYLPGM